MAELSSPPITLAILALPCLQLSLEGPMNRSHKGVTVAKIVWMIQKLKSKYCCQALVKICQKMYKKLSKSFQKVVRKDVKNNVKLSKRFQKSFKKNVGKIVIFFCFLTKDHILSPDGEKD
jgi:hypothetical protein